LEDVIPPRRVLFGLLFISLAEEEGAEMIALQPLLTLLILTAAGCSDDATCFPGEAAKM